MLIERNAGMRATQELGQQTFPLLDGFPAYVRPVEFEKVKGTQSDRVVIAPPPDHLVPRK